MADARAVYLSLDPRDVIRYQIEQLPESERPAYFAALREWIAEQTGHSADPVDAVRWVPIEKVVANSYNPNAVALNEMRLLYVSMSHDGITQPIVTVYDPERDLYVIVDGFHRFTTIRSNPDLLARTGGTAPIVVLKGSMNDRMAATVRHNRARGKHSVTGMANLVFSMLDNGASDEEVCNDLGLSVDELLRLKHITGFAKLFQSVDYRQSWETKNQIRLRKDYENSIDSAGPDQAVLEKPA